MEQTERLAQTSDEEVKRTSTPFGFTFITPLALGATLNPINSTMISTALLPIAVSLHVGVAQTGWLIAGLYLTSAVAQPTMDRFVDLFGPTVCISVPLSLSWRPGFSGNWLHRLSASSWSASS